MPADEVTHGADVEASRVRTGPRHAAPKKPLFTRFNRPTGKAIAMAAMPTAVLMGMGFTSTLAIADSNNPATPTSKSLTADEYKECVAALEDAKGGDSASPTPSTSASDGATDDKGDKDDTAPTPSPSATPGGSGNDGSSSPDSGSDDKDEPKPTPSASDPATGGDDAAATPSPSPSASGGNLLEDIGDAIGGIFDGGNKDGASPSPTPSASASESTPSAPGTGSDGKPAGDDASGTVRDTTEKATGAAEDTVEDTSGKASRTVEDTTKAVERAAEEAADEATATPSPSASPTMDPEDCPAATDAEGGVDNPVPLPDDPWYLNASSLTLKGADYQGVVEVRTANGTVKKVLKYVVSDGTDIGDLHQTVKDKQSGKTYHVQAAKGSTSTIRDGDTVMYTERISGKLLGLIPVTFDPEHPPPLNIPLIYFTDVTVQQAGQFGGTLHVPGLHNYITD
ncbi:hypothetical protein [Streptomyces lomondensis]|uniref:Membrane-bound hydrophilic protein n=1 Tax=Streptomyces lomondensis TaxID=68229 RepID=A0ABQ2XUP6_9ACTN|nr:hypothetical protein [Streptomyces lomondensis]MCF0082880.1 hypothetical protein [Streptomyces lomondensis]GGX34639.1 hypothetical protein GCM10010383_76110 [Streptomyces lomondensis]